MTISENPEIPIKNVSHNLNAQEITKIKDFIRINYSLLQRLGN
jgi:hypothetical protein